MGILDKFSTPADNTLANGSKYGPKYTATKDLPESTLAGKSSPLHANQDGSEGYSLNGEDISNVQKLYNGYDDGQINTLPDPSTLDNTYNNSYSPLNKYLNPETFSPEFGGPNPTGGLGPANPNLKP
jgi:hypothetical protein